MLDFEKLKQQLFPGFNSVSSFTNVLSSSLRSTNTDDDLNRLSRDRGTAAQNTIPATAAMDSLRAIEASLSGPPRVDFNKAPTKIVRDAAENELKNIELATDSALGQLAKQLFPEFGPPQPADFSVSVQDKGLDIKISGNSMTLEPAGKITATAKDLKDILAFAERYAASRNQQLELKIPSDILELAQANNVEIPLNITPQTTIPRAAGPAATLTDTLLQVQQAEERRFRTSEAMLKIQERNALVNAANVEAQKIAELRANDAELQFELRKATNEEEKRKIIQEMVMQNSPAFKALNERAIALVNNITKLNNDADRILSNPNTGLLERLWTYYTHKQVWIPSSTAELTELKKQQQALTNTFVSRFEQMNKMSFSAFEEQVAVLEARKAVADARVKTAADVTINKDKLDLAVRANQEADQDFAILDRRYARQAQEAERAIVRATNVEQREAAIAQREEAQARRRELQDLRLRAAEEKEAVATIEDKINREKLKFLGLDRINSSYSGVKLTNEYLAKTLGATAFSLVRSFDVAGNIVLPSQELAKLSISELSQVLESLNSPQLNAAVERVRAAASQPGFTTLLRQQEAIKANGEMPTPKEFTELLRKYYSTASARILPNDNTPYTINPKDFLTLARSNEKLAGLIEGYVATNPNPKNLPEALVEIVRTAPADKESRKTIIKELAATMKVAIAENNKINMFSLFGFPSQNNYMYIDLDNRNYNSYLRSGRTNEVVARSFNLADEIGLSNYIFSKLVR